METGVAKKLKQSSGQVMDIVALLGNKSKYQTPPFLLTFKIYNMNVHNYLADLGASTNVVPLAVCQKLKARPQRCNPRIVQMDRSSVTVLGELLDVFI